VFQVKKYANKEGKAMDPPQQNRVQITMALSEAQALSNRDKAMVKDLLDAVAEAVPAKS
jgi:hypothetical protein